MAGVTAAPRVTPLLPFWPLVSPSGDDHVEEAVGAEGGCPGCAAHAAETDGFARSAGSDIGDIDKPPVSSVVKLAMATSLAVGNFGYTLNEGETLPSSKRLVHILSHTRCVTAFAMESIYIDIAKVDSPVKGFARGSFSGLFFLARLAGFRLLAGASVRRPLLTSA
jgi:hypothetical protein